MRVNGQTLTIVGVAPKGFQGTILRLMFDMWLPAPLSTALFAGSRELDDRSVRSYSVLGRLWRPGERCRRAGRGDGVMRDLARTFPQTNTTVQADVLSFWQAPRGPQRLLATSVVLLQGITLLLLLAVCGNTANLVLARASARQQEMAVRICARCETLAYRAAAPYRKPRACPVPAPHSEPASPSGERAH